MNSKRLLQKDGVLSRKVGDEWVLYDSEKGSIHVINSMAEFVWRMCDGSHDLNNIEDHVRGAFLVPDETNLRKDVEGIIQTFANMGILFYEKV